MASNDDWGPALPPSPLLPFRVPVVVELVVAAESAGDVQRLASSAVAFMPHIVLDALGGLLTAVGRARVN